MTPTPAPGTLAEATARRERAETDVARAEQQLRRWERGTTSHHLADLQAAINEAQQRLIAACDAETRAREGR